MKESNNPVIFVAKAFWAYLSPVSRFRKLDAIVESSTSNLTEENKKILSRIYLTFFLFSSFTIIWFAYFDLKSTVEELSNIDLICSPLGTDCSDTWLSGYVKQNTFKISTLVEVLFLVSGVVVGNVGWDTSAEIKVSGLEKHHNFYKVMLIIVLAAVSIDLICNDVVAIIQGEYFSVRSSFERLLPGVLLIACLFAAHFFYNRKE